METDIPIMYEEKFNQLFSWYEDGHVTLAAIRFCDLEDLEFIERSYLKIFVQKFLEERSPIFIPAVYFFNTWDGDSCEILEEIFDFIAEERTDQSELVFCQCPSCGRLAFYGEERSDLNTIYPCCFTCSYCINPCFTFGTKKF